MTNDHSILITTIDDARSRLYLHEKRRDVMNNGAKYIIDERRDNFTSISVRELWSVSAISSLYYTN